MKPVAPSLAVLQSRFQAHLLSADRAITDCVVGDDRGGASRRLGVYRSAYVLRLVEVLGEDFPALARWLGDDGFSEVMSAYVAAHPSSGRSVRHFGDRVPAFLAARDDLSPAVAELAAFERAQSDVFDAREGAVLTAELLASLAPEVWGGMALRLRPSTRLLTQHWDTLARFQMLLASESESALDTSLPAPQPLAEPLPVLLWRGSELDVHWRSLEPDEAAALQALSSEQVDFGGVCAVLSAHVPAEEAPMRAASLLKRWLADGLLLDLFADEG
jgi:Uncharacterized protein conserved in bacteria (DUF2063).